MSESFPTPPAETPKTPPLKFEVFLKEKFPHSEVFIARLFDNKATTKQQLQSITADYTGLTFMEKCAAARIMSESAHIASPLTDDRACRVLMETVQSVHANLGKTLPPIRFIIAESDSPQASAGHFPGSKEASLILSTKMLELLSDRQLKSILAHELGHMDRDLRPNMFSQFFMQPLKHLVTRNASRRKMEYKADEFSIRATRDPEAWESATTVVNNYLVERSAAMRQSLRDSMPSEKMTRITKAMLWFFESAASKLSELIDDPQDVKPFTAWEALIQAPKYPSIIDRVRNVRETAAREGIEPPSAER